MGRVLNVRFGSKADIAACLSDVRFTPESGHVQCNSECPLSAKSGDRVLLNHLVGSQQEGLRNIQSKRFGGLVIHYQLELIRLFDR
jgi:hypothetical protein